MFGGYFLENSIFVIANTKLLNLKSFIIIIRNYYHMMLALLRHCHHHYQRHCNHGRHHLVAQTTTTATVPTLIVAEGRKHRFGADERSQHLRVGVDGGPENRGVQQVRELSEDVC